MANNITAPAQVGTVLATIQRASDQAHFQEMIASFKAADGTPSEVTAANPLPVVLSSGISTNITTKYTATNPTYTDGTTNIVLRSDQNGALLVNPVTSGAGDDFNNQVVAVADRPIAAPAYSPLSYRTAGTPVLVANIKNATGAFQSAILHNFSTTNGAWFQFHNLNTTPTAAASQVGPAFYVQPAVDATHPTIVKITRADLGGIIYCTLGLGFAWSTGENTFVQTGLTAADLREYITYV